jgi:hypothetical protein
MSLPWMNRRARKVPRPTAIVSTDTRKATIGSTLLGAVVPGIVTAVGALTLAWYTHKSQLFDQQLERERQAYNQQLERARAAASAWALADQQAQVVREQIGAAQRELLRDLASRVAGSTGSRANCPLAVGLWDSVYPGSPAPVLAAACPSQAGAGSARAHHWGVALSKESSEAVACEQAGLARSHGMATPPVYRTNEPSDNYQAVMGDYPSKSEAEPIAAFVRVEFSPDALVVQLDPKIYEFHTCFTLTQAQKWATAAIASGFPLLTREQAIAAAASGLAKNWPAPRDSAAPSP